MLSMQRIYLTPCICSLIFWLGIAQVYAQTGSHDEQHLIDEQIRILEQQSIDTNALHDLFDQERDVRSEVWERAFATPYQHGLSVMYLQATDNRSEWRVVIAEPEAGEINHGVFEIHALHSIQNEDNDPIVEHDIVAGILYGSTGSELAVYGEILTSEASNLGEIKSFMIYGLSHQIEDSIRHASQIYETLTTEPKEAPLTEFCGDCARDCGRQLISDQLRCGRIRGSCTAASLDTLGNCYSRCRLIFPLNIPRQLVCMTVCLAAHNRRTNTCRANERFCLQVAGQDHLRCLRACPPTGGGTRPRSVQ